MSKLIIIGNGFDSSHGLSTSYVAFSNYLKNNDKDSWKLLQELTDYDCEGEKWWYQFEEQLHNMRLGNLEDTIEECGSQFLEHCRTEEDEDSTREYLVNLITSQFAQLKHSFCKWIWSINENIDDYQPKAKDIVSSILDDGDLILNFNYTETVESLYGFGCYHIHGISRDPIFSVVDNDADSYIILGHEYEEELADEKYEEDFNDSYFAEGLLVIEQEYRKIFSKNCIEIIEEEPFFTHLENNKNSIDEVIVMGHSLAEVDAPYIRKIVNIIGDSLPWKISVYGGNDREMINKVKSFSPNSIVTTFELK